ncbi:hypothetical protein SSX86_016287 [Deinandra increscens subsp. villosa]|uniref:Phytosulfokine n=1 Tax=Deinandra increscens subsp. villosa TaxID=3103831 RepID=A0AAP0GZW3_9ASTR
MTRATIFFLTLSLLISATLPSARQEPTTTTTPSNDVDVEECCEGVGEEECLMRRTLVAHLDYIYTQKKNP